MLQLRRRQHVENVIKYVAYLSGIQAQRIEIAVKNTAYRNSSRENINPSVEWATGLQIRANSSRENINPSVEWATGLQIRA